eukprot:COSAG05_NODE_485_length_9349_cov_60.192865_7_plen_209_part_00
MRAARVSVNIGRARCQDCYLPLRLKQVQAPALTQNSLSPADVLAVSACGSSRRKVIYRLLLLGRLRCAPSILKIELAHDTRRVFASRRRLRFSDRRGYSCGSPVLPALSPTPLLPPLLRRSLLLRRGLLRGLLTLIPLLLLEIAALRSLLLLQLFAHLISYLLRCGPLRSGQLLLARRGIPLPSCVKVGGAFFKYLRTWRPTAPSLVS